MIIPTNTFLLPLIIDTYKLQSMLIFVHIYEWSHDQTVIENLS